MKLKVYKSGFNPTESIFIAKFKKIDANYNIGIAKFKKNCYI
jgi:hypothetical protein